MPRNKPKRGRRGTGMFKVVSVPFRRILSVASVLGTDTFTELDLTLANLGARAVAVGSAFEFFRLKKLRVYQVTTAVAATTAAGSGGGNSSGVTKGHHAVAFVESNAALTGACTTVAQMSQYELFRFGNLFEKLSTSVPKKLLGENQLKWFHTASTGTTSDMISAGLVIQLIFVDANSAVTVNELPACSTIVEGIVEFQGYITPALAFASDPAPYSRSLPADDSKSDISYTHVADPTLQTRVRESTLKAGSVLGPWGSAVVPNETIKKVQRLEAEIEALRALASKSDV